MRDLRGDNSDASLAYISVGTLLISVFGNRKRNNYAMIMLIINFYFH